VKRGGCEGRGYAKKGRDSSYKETMEKGNSILGKGLEISRSLSPSESRMKKKGRGRKKKES